MEQREQAGVSTTAVARATVTGPRHCDWPLGNHQASSAVEQERREDHRHRYHAADGRRSRQSSSRVLLGVEGGKSGLDLPENDNREEEEKEVQTMDVARRAETYSPTVSFHNLFQYVHDGHREDGGISMETSRSNSGAETWSGCSSSPVPATNDMQFELTNNNNSNELESSGNNLKPMHSCTNVMNEDDAQDEKQRATMIQKNTGLSATMIADLNNDDTSNWCERYLVGKDSIVLVPGGGHVHVKTVVHHQDPLPMGAQTSCKGGRGWSKEHNFFSNEFNQLVAKSVNDIGRMMEACRQGMCDQADHNHATQNHTSLSSSLPPPSQCSWMYIRHNCDAMNAETIVSTRSKSTTSYGWGMVPMVLQSGCAPGEVQDGWMSSSGTNTTQKSISSVSEHEIELISQLGRGSFGQVYRGRVAGIERAIKSIQIEEKELEKVIREAEMGCFLAHPNVVRTIMYKVTDCKRHCLETYMGKITLAGSASGSSSSDSQPTIGVGRMVQSNDASDIEDSIVQMYIIQELCDVGAMSSYIECDDFFKAHMTQPSMTLLDCIVLTALDVINSLIYLGHNGIIHGDLSSNNVMFTTDSTSPLGLRAKVIDFGRSRVEKSTNHITNTLGTISHMPPEMLLTGELNKTADMYAVGILVLEMWTKTHAWHGRHAVQILFAMSSGRRVKVPDDIPPSLRSFILHCLNDDPHNRPLPEEAFETLKAMIHPRLVMNHLINTSVASRLV